MSIGTWCRICFQKHVLFIYHLFIIYFCFYSLHFELWLDFTAGFDFIWFYLILLRSTNLIWCHIVWYYLIFIWVFFSRHEEGGVWAGTYVSRGWTFTPNGKRFMGTMNRWKLSKRLLPFFFPRRCWHSAFLAAVDNMQVGTSMESDRKLREMRKCTEVYTRSIIYRALKMGYTRYEVYDVPSIENGTPHSTFFFLISRYHCTHGICTPYDTVELPEAFPPPCPSPFPTTRNIFLKVDTTTQPKKSVSADWVGRRSKGRFRR